MFVLMIQRRGESTLRYRFNQLDVSIGSDASNDVVLAASNVAPRHARIVVEGGRFTVVDMGSPHGVHVGGRRVTLHTTVDRNEAIRIGPFILRIVAEAIPEHEDWEAFGDMPTPRVLDDELAAGLDAEPNLATETILRPESSPPSLDAMERELLQAIHEQPLDDTPRLVYADMLMERGDLRGDFIAWQCARSFAAQAAENASPTPDDPERIVHRRWVGDRDDAEMGDVLDRHGAEWLRPVIRHRSIRLVPATGGARVEFANADLPIRPVFLERGFFSYPICVTAGQLQQEGDGLLRLSPTLYEVGEPITHGVSMLQYHLPMVVHRGHRIGPTGRDTRVAIKRATQAATPGERHIPGYGCADLAKMLCNAYRLGKLVAHPNVVRFLGLAYWAGAGDLALATEWLDGWNLRQIIEQAARTRRPVSPALALAIIGHVSRALDYIHSTKTKEVRRDDWSGGLESVERPAGIVHNRLRPDHVMVTREGRVKIINFRWARAHASLLPYPGVDPDGVGRPIEEPDVRSYRAPEVILGSAPSSRSDQYSLGLMLFELLCGRHPFVQGNGQASDGERLSDVETMMSRVDVPMLPRSVSVPRLPRMIAISTARIPDRRYASAWHLHHALQSVVSEQGWRSEPRFIAGELARIMAGAPTRPSPTR